MEYIVSKDKVILIDCGRVLAELDYPVIKGVATINRTFVDESLRGQGIAGELMKRAIEYLRQKNIKAVPTCSYAVNWFEKHPDDRDLLY